MTPPDHSTERLEQALEKLIRCSVTGDVIEVEAGFLMRLVREVLRRRDAEVEELEALDEAIAEVLRDELGPDEFDLDLDDEGDAPEPSRTISPGHLGAGDPERQRFLGSSRPDPTHWSLRPTMTPRHRRRGYWLEGRRRVWAGIALALVVVVCLLAITGCGHSDRGQHFTLAATLGQGAFQVYVPAEMSAVRQSAETASAGTHYAWLVVTMATAQHWRWWPQATHAPLWLLNGALYHIPSWNRVSGWKVYVWDLPGFATKHGARAGRGYVRADRKEIHVASLGATQPWLYRCMVMALIDNDPYWQDQALWGPVLTQIEPAIADYFAAFPPRIK